MNFAVSKTRSTLGLCAQRVFVEVHLSNGLPGFTIVGLAETAVKESKDRVRSAIINSQFEFPSKKITVNLAPADLPKTGSGFDLPIAIGILAASGQIPTDKLATHELIAELALNGNLRGIPAIIPIILATKQQQQPIIIATANAEEASIAWHDAIYLSSSLREVCHFLSGNAALATPTKHAEVKQSVSDLDWSDVKGQHHAKHALEVAAVGGHNILLCGPPGSGKTMLAKRFSSLLPLLTEEQAFECAAIYSVAKRPIKYTDWRQAPFRAPHHTASPIALVGGGSPPRPGEISLAHHGVLFLDELPEFHRHVLETLREPLESGQICISRAATQTEFPARFQLIAAMNPCPCGNYGNACSDCHCTPDAIKRYLGKLSAPFLDRIDMQITVQALPILELIKQPVLEKKQSALIQQNVAALRHLQIERQGCTNANLSAHDCETLCHLHAKEYEFINQTISKLNLSARAFHRLLKVSRTIADMRQAPEVSTSDIKQALSFRQMSFVESY